ncbi:MAG: hypothetical protein RL308_2925, partial [Bacteroidota bacterium]
MKHSFFTLLFFIFISTFSYAQCGFLDTCPNTDYFNFGMRSTTDATTLEYDNFTSSFHSTVVRTSLGVYKVWGEDMSNDGTTDLLSPIELTSANYPALTGTVLKAGLGSLSANAVQGIVLATDGLYAWSLEGQVLHANITSSTTFQKLTINGNSQGLPTGVTPTDVKMMFVTNQTIALVTCNGEVWVISQIAQNTGTGITTITAANAVKWYRVTQSTAGNPLLSNVIAVRGQESTLFALKSDGTIWTWGAETYLGDGTAITARTRATPMTLPSVNGIKMIGVTREDGTTGLSYYVLNANGNLYSLGANDFRQLGDWTTTERKVWIQPRYTSATGPVMNNIHWISPNEHDNQYGAISVLTSDSKIYNWGNASTQMLGRGGTGSFSPGIPNGILSTDAILAVETGGHTTMVSKQCQDNFGYVGHRIRGSMGDGSSTTTTEASFTFATAVVYVCGASTLDLQLTGSIVTGTNGKYCNGTSATLIPSPAGGTLSLVSGPATLSSNILNFTGSGNQTVVVQYTYTDPTCGISKSISLNLLTENCILPPSISSTGVLSAFSACSNSVSSEQSFTVSGTSLTANLVVTAPAGYEISTTSGTGFATSLTLTQSGGTITSTTIHVRLATTATNGASGNITLVSGSTTQNVATIAAVVSNLVVTPASQTNVACNGGSNGAATINAPTGGTAAYTYNWTPGNPTGDGTTTVTGLTTGTWTCTVTDANGCNRAQNFTITQPTAIAVTPASQTNVACNGGSNGAASINTPTGGAGGYTYNWTPGNPTGDGTTSATGLIAGSWTCTVTDANGCTRAQNFTITQPTAIAVTPASQTNVACNGGSNGAASINTPTGGAGGYTYNWTPGNPTGDGTTSATGLIAGSWTCTVTDANSCTATRNFTITQPTAISTATASQTNVSCNGGSNGAASVTPSGGASGYTYS